jgi:hypothetical protein
VHRDPAHLQQRPHPSQAHGMVSSSQPLYSKSSTHRLPASPSRLCGARSPDEKLHCSHASCTSAAPPSATKRMSPARTSESPTACRRIGCGGARRRRLPRQSRRGARGRITLEEISASVERQPARETSAAAAAAAFSGGR